MDNDESKAQREAIRNEYIEFIDMWQCHLPPEKQATYEQWLESQLSYTRMLLQAKDAFIDHLTGED